jgi:hypothetical protein
MSHHHQEADRSVEIADDSGRNMGKGNQLAITIRHKEEIM